jgi:IS30 family transposase
MSQITYEQRYTISVMMNQGFSNSKIGEVLGKDRSVIGREIKRNKDERSGKYSHELAEKKCNSRHKQKAKHVKFTPEIRLYVDNLLSEDLSPEQVVGVSKKDGIACVSHERIYQYVWLDKKLKGKLYTHLRRKGRKYRKRGSSKDSRGIIKDRISIEQRPDIVDKKVRFGDIEVDLIIGKKNKEAIVTVNDRVAGVLKMKKVQSKEAIVVANAINELLEDWKPFLHTITSDNGKEFAAHEFVANYLNIDYYFAHPYHSWERGANENLNGLIRQYIPKKTDFSTLTDDYIKLIETKLNNRPRKRYNFENPIFVMEKILFNSDVAFIS